MEIKKLEGKTIKKVIKTCEDNEILSIEIIFTDDTKAEIKPESEDPFCFVELKLKHE